MFKSLRWRLQAWHAVILLLAVGGFGTVLYWEVSKARHDEIDGDLLAAARTLDGALRGIPRPVLESGFRNAPRGDFNPPPRDQGPPDGPPPGDDLSRDDRPPPYDDRPPRGDPRFRPDAPRGPDQQGRPGANRPDSDFSPDAGRGPEQSNRPDRPPRGQQPPRPMPPEQIQRMLTLPQSFVERFTEHNQGPYFTIWAANGEVLKQQAVPDELPAPQRLPMRPGVDFRSQQRGIYREVILDGPEHARILVGRSTEKETGELSRLFWQILITGCGVFVTGLAGGWWLSGRAVKPIEKMSRTAASISASNLSQRIDVSDVDTELAALGRVLNAMFERIQSAFEQQMRFTADASHELRTPLTVVLTHAELALNRSRSPDEYRETLATCLRAAQRMKFLVEDLLVLARADAGKLELHRVRLDLKQIAEDCVALLQPLADQRQVEVTVEGETAIVVGDPDRLAQVITNLLSNAIQYNVENGRVRVRTHVDKSEVVLEIVDTGLGIPAADLPHVFERFFRVDRARSRTSGGSGLGLAICKMIAEAHGGSIAIANNAASGTTVSLRLPAASMPRQLAGEERVPLALEHR